MIVLPSPPLACHHPSSQPQPQPSSTVRHAKGVAKGVARRPATAATSQSKPEFEPIRTHRIISAATAASVRSPYRRSDDTAVSFARLRYRPNQSATPLSTTATTTDDNNNQCRWKRSLPSSPRQSQRKQSKRSTNNYWRNKYDDSITSNRHLSARNISDNNDSSNNPLRYTSRVIISDDFSQVEIKSDDNEVEPVSREGKCLILLFAFYLEIEPNYIQVCPE